MIHYVIQRLSASTDITDETGTRIFPLFRLQGSEIPAITVQLVGTEPTDTKDTPSNFESNSVEITVFHEDPANAWDLAMECRKQLDGWSSSDVRNARFVNQATDIFEATEVFSVTQRYEIQTDYVPIGAPPVLEIVQNVTVTDTDGTDNILTPGTAFICTQPTPQLGIFYQRSLPWTNNDPGIDGSVFWHIENNTYDYIYPANPQYIAAKKNEYTGTDADSLLMQPNAFGNYYRFTNDRGEQYTEEFHISPNNTSDNPQYCIDHYTGAAWYVQRNRQLSNSEDLYRSYREAIAYANDFTYAGYDDWRLADVGEYLEATAHNDYQNSYEGVYAPFVDPGIRQHGGGLLTGTYDKDNRAVRIWSNSATISRFTDLDSPATQYLLLIRNHYT